MADLRAENDLHICQDRQRQPKYDQRPGVGNDDRLLRLLPSSGRGDGQRRSQRKESRADAAMDHCIGFLIQQNANPAEDTLEDDCNHGNEC